LLQLALNFEHSSMTSTPTIRSRPASRRLVSFALGDQAYALPLAAVQEILPMAQLTRPPGLPSVLEGFLNLRGRAAAVINLSRLFGLPATPVGLYTPLLILRDLDFPLALLVDRVTGLTSISEDSIARLGENYTSNDCAEGVTMTDESVLVMLSVDRILFGRERSCLAELQATEQARVDALQETAS
jgi:purine-binding chemotaxis protein CheW